VAPRLLPVPPPDWGWQEGRLPGWRLRVELGLIEWTELLGAQGRQDAEHEVGDVMAATPTQWWRITWRLLWMNCFLASARYGAVRTSWSSTAPRLL